MATLQNMARRQHVLEVERTLRSLAVPDLTRHAGVPPFQSLQPLPATTIHDVVQRIAGETARAAPDNLGMEPLATFTTRRRSWQADGDFRIVLDTMDFGHEVGEVELQQTMAAGEGNFTDEVAKADTLRAMGERIGRFMQKYAWVFTPGAPKGKLTAYFVWQQEARQQR